MENFGDRVKAERIARGWSQGELGRRVGASTSTISDIENNPTRVTTKLVALARALRVTAEWLETGKEPKARAVDLQTAYIVAEDIHDLADKLLSKGPEAIGELMKIIAESSINRQK
ncbi:helix-turn-helix domain-containing protein [Aquitalea magnusonii]|uniref:DNA-binding XRE family transcriptional regulator n=1 Tax=Aquitalea magnusonii TaxID=332411 RepID=A0A318JPS7_9NEIS|nr:helix-turn-helix transcriptional regulator [Aquitalea magnusonii]PXX42240.1 DNA-binding XRE family transcriptional regulator [Aquitalea magnusonii]